MQDSSDRPRDASLSTPNNVSPTPSPRRGSERSRGNTTHALSPNKTSTCSVKLTPQTQKIDPRFGPRPNRKQSQEQPKRQDGRQGRQPFEGIAHLYEVIQVRLLRTQRLVEVNTNGFRLSPGMPVLVRVHRNILLATTTGYRHRRVAEINSLPFVLRIASEEDKAIDADNAMIEKHAQELASSYAIEQGLQMKVLSADLSHDHKNITINFASDVRVDFREMVAYLAGQLHLRVEMYQLGLRNGTGIICGLGSCGQLLCCGRFLGQFDPIAVKQLRAQGLATNPKRISGVCGRLYCCMSYEYFDYMKERKTLPKKGKRIFSRWGIGRVTDIDMLREEVVVTYENGEVQRLTLHDFVPLTDEIAAKVEAGECEFPLEPAHFYLNHDPSAAAEAGTQTKLIKSDNKSQPRRELPAKRSNLTRRENLSPTPAPKKRPEPNTSQDSRPTAVKRKSTTTHHKTTSPQSNPPETTPQNAAPPTTENHGHVTRMTRKVHARQANLEESMNQTSEMRRTPAKPSRRIYSPMSPPHHEKS